MCRSTVEKDEVFINQNTVGHNEAVLKGVCEHVQRMNIAVFVMLAIFTTAVCYFIIRLYERCHRQWIQEEIGLQAIQRIRYGHYEDGRMQNQQHNDQLTAALGIIRFPQVARTATWKSPAIKYVQDSLETQDFYFDRIVPLSTKDENRQAINYGIGVHISSDRILTSFNPFRRIIRDATMLQGLYATSLTGRRRHTNSNWSYMYTVSHIACGRQIQDLPDEAITKGKLWHGQGDRHCPLHDLLVFRIYNNLTISTVATKDHIMERWPPGKETHIKTEVFLTKLAEPEDQIGVDFKFCAIVKKRLLKVTYYTEDDNALLDCQEWLPPNWGYFICILNKNKYKGVSSGAMLVSNEKLFGVASFVLTRGDKGIIVFTDVRPYYDLIQNTCTYADSAEVPPKKFPGTDNWDKPPTTTTTTKATTQKPQTQGPTLDPCDPANLPVVDGIGGAC